MIEEKLEQIKMTLEHAPCVSMSSNGLWKSWQFDKDKILLLLAEIQEELPKR